MSTPDGHITPASTPTPGKVIFIGAGPGDPELLTVKALRWLQRADVIIADRLVSPEILSHYTTVSATVIHAGKQGGSNGSTAQPAINELLVAHAKAGQVVVRLKGGDVSIFSNILDELQTLVANDIGYELVPGITAAIGAAAYAGIPLTARGYSTAVRLLTAYREDLLDDHYWHDLAQTEDTLVFYMSSAPADQLVGRLLANGIPEDRWITVIEQATTPKQCVSGFPIHEYPQAAAGRSWQSPSLIIIGKVGALQQSFSWLSDTLSSTPYFPPIEPVISKKTLLC
ncbi:MAG TPA: uroporphyrinogen-III C-methyltransferase [Puia sp.]|jgi:uroporphyrin-III C-methyltransferase/precorrin-2 dehydrogenase/sirohydrochlorin ferrochelatase/uroporphyrin-III C-methyltransferase|nr:uroporphyrinogen-III C-methyltransferase [Puia sp.]